MLCSHKITPDVGLAVKAGGEISRLPSVRLTTSAGTRAVVYGSWSLRLSAYGKSLKFGRDKGVMRGEGGAMQRFEVVSGRGRWCRAGDGTASKQREFFHTPRDVGEVEVACAFAVGQIASGVYYGFACDIADSIR